MQSLILVIEDRFCFAVNKELLQWWEATVGKHCSWEKSVLLWLIPGCVVFACERIALDRREGILAQWKRQGLSPSLFRRREACHVVVMETGRRKALRCCKHHSIICEEPFSEKQKVFASQGWCCKLWQDSFLPIFLPNSETNTLMQPDNELLWQKLKSQKHC